MKTSDITFIGHICFDEIIPFQGDTVIAPGSAVICGSLAAARAGKQVTVVTKMNTDDSGILADMHHAGVEIIVIPAPQTSYMQVIHPSENVDERRMFHQRNAGYFSIDDVPAIDTRFLHLAGICDREFTLDFVRALHSRGYSLSVDMQSFVRQVEPSTREVHFRNVPDARELVSLMDRVKLDVVEAELTTGHKGIEQAASVYEAWGCPEIVITESKGVLARVQGKTFYEKFSNRSAVGRTGRGDTTFAGYLAWRLDHSPEESLKFAAALASIKMEAQGPFHGTLEDVLARMREIYS